MDEGKERLSEGKEYLSSLHPNEKIEKPSSRFSHSSPIDDSFV
jgi:hypothetical protein